MTYQRFLLLNSQHLESSIARLLDWDEFSHLVFRPHVGEINVKARGHLQVASLESWRLCLSGLNCRALCPSGQFGGYWSILTQDSCPSKRPEIKGLGR